MDGKCQCSHIFDILTSDTKMICTHFFLGLLFQPNFGSRAACSVFSTHPCSGHGRRARRVVLYELDHDHRHEAEQDERHLGKQRGNIAVYVSRIFVNGPNKHGSICSLIHKFQV